jgi:hypothetical protein
LFLKIEIGTRNKPFGYRKQQTRKIKRFFTVGRKFMCKKRDVVIRSRVKIGVGKNLQGALKEETASFAS